MGLGLTLGLGLDLEGRLHLYHEGNNIDHKLIHP